MPIVAGVDPGKKGAITLIDSDALSIYIFDMPVIAIGKSGKRSEVDAQELANILDGFILPDILVAEDVWSSPNDGHVGAFSFGDSVGVIRGVTAALGIQFQRARPQVWKASMKVTADKKSSRDRAALLVPSAAKMYSRAKDDGRAESTLIGLYGTFNNGVKITGPLQLMESE